MVCWARGGKGGGDGIGVLRGMSKRSLVMVRWRLMGLWLRVVRKVFHRDVAMVWRVIGSLVVV